mgnify:CR=1 FL=1
MDLAIDDVYKLNTHTEIIKQLHEFFKEENLSNQNCQEMTIPMDLISTISYRYRCSIENIIQLILLLST